MTAFFSVFISNDVLPFQNPFSAKLAQFGFYLYLVLVVDLMHEFELRVWKAVFIFCVFWTVKLGYLHLDVMEYEKQDQTDLN